MLKRLMVKSCLLTLLSCVSLVAHAMADSPKPIDIPAGNLVPALEALQKQAAVELVYQAEQIKLFRTSGAKGTYTAHDAVMILLKGTPLELRTDLSGAMLIAPPQKKTATSMSNSRDARIDASKEGKSDSSHDFRVAQVGQTSAGSAIATPEQTSEKKPTQLEEVIVTGSRIPTTAQEGAQEVKIYTQEQIEQSGQTTIAEFLNTIPEVSTAITESVDSGLVGGSAITLRGLPLGTTLLLINGRRLETSGAQAMNDVFDLNSIPLSAVERVEVIANGSSAVYGSDAIAGVVNIILKKNLEGAEITAKYGWASGTDEVDTSLAWGGNWERGAVSIIGSYQGRSELTEADRSITASNNYIPLGGPNRNYPYCNPGNVFSLDGNNLPGLNSPYAAVPAGYRGRPSIQEFQSTAGTLNNCVYGGAMASLIPGTHRVGLLAEGSFKVLRSLELFSELLFSHVEQNFYYGYQGLYGMPGYTPYTVPSSNPYNPFGTTVGISELFTSLPRNGILNDTNFVRPLVGARGNFQGSWRWEVAAWEAADFTDSSQPLENPNNAAIENALNSSNPSTALNPFTAGAPTSQAELRSFFSDGLVTYSGRAERVNGFVQGPLVTLPSGKLNVVLGGEYGRDTLSSDQVDLYYAAPNTRSNFHRDSHAVFAEARIPILSNQKNPQAGDLLALSIAGRRDSYSDFGSKLTPQIGGEWRPVDGLLVRATYAESFKAPTLYELHAPRLAVVSPIVDPQTGQTYSVTEIWGGNPNLRPETGQSRTFGFVYASKTIPNLQVSVTLWHVEERNVIENIYPLVLLQNPNEFPGAIVRGPGSNGHPGMITTIYDTYFNFGGIDVSGLDYQLNYRRETTLGTFMASFSVSETYRYTSELTPGAPAVDGASKAQDSGNWAPRWKGKVGLGWKLGSYSASVGGRFVGRYRDYDPLTDGQYQELGNFWLCDANLRYAIGQSLASSSPWLKGTYLEFGGINLFNRLPQYSNYTQGYVGYDPTQADIRGRFLYVVAGAKF